MGRSRSLLALSAALVLASGCASSSATPSSPAPTGSTASPGASASTPAATPTPPPSATPSPTPAPYANLILYYTPPGAGAQNGAYYLIGADGTGKRSLAAGRFAHWTADGSGIEIVSIDNKTCVPSLTVYHVDGSAPTPVGIDFKAGDTWFSWTPDGTRLAFFRYTSGKLPYPCGQGGMGASAAALQRNLYVVNSDGSDLNMIQSKVPGVEPLAWMPDGSSLLMIRHGASDMDGPIVRIDVATHVATVVIASGTYQAITVSPDGQLISYTKYAGTGTLWRLQTAAIDGTNKHDLGSNTAWDYQLTWGSDNAHAALQRAPVAADHTLSDHLYWLDPTVTPVSIVHVTADAETITMNVDWSPGDDWLAYVGVAHSGGNVHPGPVTLIHPDGTGKTALAGTNNVEWLAWQPMP
jgi:Tol biopolymer transport system component